MDLSGKKVAVLDTIHGGKTICHRLQRAGIDAVAIDIYKDLLASTVIDAYDVIIAPIHAKSSLIARAHANGIPVLTHHEVVGQLARQSEQLHDALVFEITGVRAKTTTAVLLEQAVSDKPLISLTSRGLVARERGKYIARNRLSITPANVLVALDLIEEYELSPEVCIFETSLGGPGIGDLNILTTLSPEYSIAQGDRTSTDAKLQMISNARAGSCLVAPLAVTTRTSSMCINSIGDVGANVHYKQERTREIRIRYDALQRAHGDQISGELSFTPTGRYDFLAYRTSVLCFVAAGLAAHFEPRTIERTLSLFEGVVGRASITEIEQRTMVDNSNSGLDEASIERAIDFGLSLKKPGHRAVLIIGEEAKNICSGITPDAIASAANNEAFEHIVLVGERMRVSRAHVTYRADLESAIRAAKQLTSEGDVIVSCVKMWR